MGYLQTLIDFCSSSTLLKTLRLLAESFGVTAAIFFLTVVFSLPLGMGICSLRMSKIKPIAWLMRIYISIMRGTPLMLQLLVIYYGPYYIFGIFVSDSYRFPAVIIAFSLNYAAYFAEIYRAGIQSIPIGQYEAADVLGYSRIQTFFKIILPQVIKRTLPPVTNEIITLTKDTSLAFALGCAEMFTIAKRQASGQTSMTPYIAAAVFYYIFNFVVAYGMGWLEKKLDYYR